jgi:hypothetical protein
MTISHSLDGIAGSITKLEKLSINLLTSLNNISAINTIAFADIITSGAFEQIEIVPEAGFKCKLTETPNGPMNIMEVNGAIMNDDVTTLFNLSYNRYVLLITDGIGKRWLFGNKTEYFKYELDTDSKTSRSANQTQAINFKGAMTSPLLLVL